jgi:predicted negative regulator of RcsB-dependent stress response
VSVHLDEEQQLEQLKRLWREYGKTVMLVVLISVGGYFSWTGWQNQQRAKAEATSVVYQDLLELVGQSAGELTEEQRATAAHLVAEIKDKHSKSQYAYNAALLAARIAVEQDDLETAASELQWVLDQTPSAATDQLTRARLARVLLAQQNYSEALALIALPPSDSFAAEYAEIRGDILVAQGEIDAARTAYQAALSSLTSEQQQRGMLLQMKLDDLKVPAVKQEQSAPEAETAPEENAS